MALMAIVSELPAQRQLANSFKSGNIGAMGGGGGSSSRSSSKSSSEGGSEEDPCIPLDDARHCWTIDPLTGLIHPTVPDTTYLDLARTDAMESHAMALVYTGNLFSPHQVEYFLDRKPDHDFFFLNAYNLFRKNPEDIEFYRTKIPFTVAAYSKSGANLQENDHLKLRFAGNFGSEIGLGTSLDYVYARGEYSFQSAKPLNWSSYLYYEGETYKAYLTYSLQKLANQENGGVLNRDYILNPDAYEDMYTEPRTMETRLVNAWSDNVTSQVHFTHNYNFGRWEEHRDPNDTTNVWDELVPIGTFFHTVKLESDAHNFRMDKGGEVTGSPFFTNHYYDLEQTADSTKLINFSTYAGVKLNEGFSKYSQFSLSAFAGYERNNYTVLDSLGVLANGKDTIGWRNHAENNFWIGAQLSRHQSSALQIDVTARTCLPGSNDAGDVELTGKIGTVIPFGKRVTLPLDSLALAESMSSDTLDMSKDKDLKINIVKYGRSDSLLLSASGYIRNSHVSYLMENYFGNHFRWNNTNFKTEKRVRIEGTLTYPRTGTTLRGGIEHISNFHYFDQNFLPAEYGKQLEVYSAELQQKVSAGPLHWDTRLLYQHSLDDKVLPLPSFSVQTDLNIRFRIAKVLWTQLGVMGSYHTKYYAPTYQPATQQFAVQREVECGGFPVLNGYMNCNLKRIKFFIAMYNFLNQSVTNDIFIMPDYPMMPRRFIWGVTLDLQN